MLTLVIGLTIFFAIHLVPSMTAFRRALVGKLGIQTYQGLYAITAVLGFILIVYGKSTAPFQPIWEPPDWGTRITITIMPLAFVLLAAANMHSNIKRFTRHPMLWGVVTWSAAHLSANGDLASILLFGAFGCFSLFAMLSANLRGEKKQQTRYPYAKDAIVIVAACIAYGIFFYAHPYLFGVPIT